MERRSPVDAIFETEGGERETAELSGVLALVDASVWVGRDGTGRFSAICNASPTMFSAPSGRILPG